MTTTSNTLADLTAAAVAAAEAHRNAENAAIRLQNAARYLRQAKEGADAHRDFGAGFVAAFAEAVAYRVKRVAELTAAYEEAANDARNADAALAAACAAV